MSVPAQRHYSVEEYFGIEEMSPVRHEYLGGEIYALPGGSRNHNQIAQNLTRAFDGVRARGCRTYLSDVRLLTPGGLYTYPDVTSRDPVAARLPARRPVCDRSRAPVPRRS